MTALVGAFRERAVGVLAIEELARGAKSAEDRLAALKLLREIEARREPAQPWQVEAATAALNRLEPLRTAMLDERRPAGVE